MNKQPPPRWAQRFFRWFCHPAYYEDLAGDLAELYDERIQQDGARKARWKYTRDILLLFRPSIIRPIHTYSILIHPAMFRNYLKVSLRNLWKYKSYALLNIFGLAVGIAAAIVLFLIVRYEMSFDTFHAEHERVYRVGEGTVADGEDARLRDAVERSGGLGGEQRGCDQRKRQGGGAHGGAETDECHETCLLSAGTVTRL